jgi:hypothetical protein
MLSPRRIEANAHGESGPYQHEYREHSAAKAAELGSSAYKYRKSSSPDLPSRPKIRGTVQTGGSTFGSAGAS